MASETLLSITDQTDTAALMPVKQVVADPPILFSQLTLPVGIATDVQGNVLVGFENLGGAIAFFDPAGNVLGQVQLSPLISPVDLYSNARLALEPSSGQVLALFPAGLIQAIDPSTGSVTPIIDLKQLPIRTDRVYDVAQGAVVDATALIQPALANYGDIAVFNGDGFTDLYISGLSTAFPFVMRLRVTQSGLSSADVIVSSIASAAPNQGQPPGVAVNAQGTVLTTLPIPNATATGNFNAPVYFPIDLDLYQGVGSFFPQVIGTDVASTGMTADAAGNFYISTSAVGTSLGGVAGAGSVVVLSPELQVLNVLSIAQNVTLASNDVAVNPTGDRLYVTFNNTLTTAGGVALFRLTSSQDALMSLSGTGRLVGADDGAVDDMSSVEKTLNSDGSPRVDLSWLSHKQSFGKLDSDQLKELGLDFRQNVNLNGLTQEETWTRLLA